jgi:hypothetical protein
LHSFGKGRGQKYRLKRPKHLKVTSTHPGDAARVSWAVVGYTVSQQTREIGTSESRSIGSPALPVMFTVIRSESSNESHRH